MGCACLMGVGAGAACDDDERTGLMVRVEGRRCVCPLLLERGRLALAAGRVVMRWRDGTGEMGGLSSFPLLEMSGF